jgi:hypothetical protein
MNRIVAGDISWPSSCKGSDRMTKLSDLGPPIAKRQGTETAGEEYNFYSVPHCGQLVHKRDLREVLYLNSLHMIRWILNTARQSLMFPGVPKITTLCGLEGDTLPAAPHDVAASNPPLPEATAG